MPKRREINRREGEVLVVIANLATEFGIDNAFTRGAVEHVLGSPCAGSLGGLAMLGYVTQRTGPEGLEYRLTATGLQAAKLIVEGRRPVMVNGHDRGR